MIDRVLTLLAVIICGEAIQDEAERASLFATLKDLYPCIVDITLAQAESYCACVQLLHGTPSEQFPTGGPILAMSTAAFNAFREDQKQAIDESTPGIKWLHVPLDTIEAVSGGSVRSMLGRLV